MFDAEKRLSLRLEGLNSDEDKEEEDSRSLSPSLLWELEVDPDNDVEEELSLDFSMNLSSIVVLATSNLILSSRNKLACNLLACSASVWFKVGRVMNSKTNTSTSS